MMAYLVTIAPRLWPAVAGICGAVYFASTGDFTHASEVLLAGFGVAQAIHAASSRPAA